MADVHPGQLALSIGFGVCAAASTWRALRRRSRPLLLLPPAFILLAVLSANGLSFDRVVSQGTAVPLPLAVLQWFVGCGFFLIGVSSVIDWLRHRGRPRLLLAGSIGLLGALSLYGQIGMRYPATPQPTIVTLSALLVSGYLFYLFRASLIPSRPSTTRLIGALVLIGAVLGSVVSLPSSRDVKPTYSVLQGFVVIVVVGIWGYCVGEPCLRLWFHSRTLPVVQRMRARSLALGYGGIILILVIAVPLILAFKQLQSNAGFTYGLEAVVVAAMPLMFAALFPPAWLRRIWRETEEEGFRLATHQLLLGSPDARALAAQCLQWAVRLVGAEAGCIVGLDGEMLATSNLSLEQGLMLAGASHHEEGRQALRLTPEEEPSNVIIVPMRSDFGFGAISVVAGRFTPVLGSDEVNRLSQYAASVTAAFDRLMLLDQLTEARAVAEQASRRKSEYLSRMSHELRTPMSAIIGFAELLALNDPRADQSADINAIVKAADHLLALINEVLEITLIESGSGSLSLEPVSLNDVADQAIALIDRRARMEHITVRKEVHSDHTFVLADMQRLRQVMINLLSNAVKYNRIDGSITLKTTESNGTIRLEVIDTGQGIPAETIDRVFDAFDRLGQERSQVEGTGLGLALTKALVEAMHGSIGVESQAGVGSTFWVELQKTEPAVPDLSGDAVDTEPTLAPARVEFRDIVYVEDNLVNAELVDRILTQERPRLRLVPIAKGLDALAYLEKHHPGLILLDLHLEDINGDEVLRRIRANPRLQDIPVVMLSADAAKSQIDRLTSMGANDYLTKPVRVKTLLRVVDEGLGGTLKSSRIPEEEGGSGRSAIAAD